MREMPMRKEELKMPDWPPPKALSAWDKSSNSSMGTELPAAAPALLLRVQLVLS
jgi:hypothetical protein